MTDDDLKYLRAVGVLMRRGYAISDDSGAVERAADEIERLRGALEAATNMIQRDRRELFHTHRSPKTGKVEDKEGQEGLAEYDAVLTIARAALNQQENV